MKKFLFSLGLLLALSFAANAQTQAGNFIVGGAVGWSNINNEFDILNSPNSNFNESEQNELRLQPKVGLFLKSNLTMGLFLDYNYIKYKSRSVSDLQNNTGWSTNSTLTGGAFIRKYFPLNERFSFYGEGMLGYATVKSKSESNMGVGYTWPTWGVAAIIRPGLAFFATNKLGIDLTVQGLQYNIWKTKDVKRLYGTLDTRFYLPYLNFGINFYLNR